MKEGKIVKVFRENGKLFLLVKSVDNIEKMTEDCLKVEIDENMCSEFVTRMVSVAWGL